MKRLVQFLLVALALWAVPLLAAAEQAVYWTLGCRAELLASPSNNAMCLAVAREGQIVLVKTAQDNGWAHVAYTDHWTGMGFEGWISVSALPSPPQPYDALLEDAEAVTAARLDGFFSRVDGSAIAPDFVFEGWVEEYFHQRCIAVVDSGEIYMRVDQVHSLANDDVIEYFVVYEDTQAWIDQAPVLGRLNATAWDGETMRPSVYEGVMDYALGSTQMYIVPVFRDSGIRGYSIQLMPTGGIVRDNDADDAPPTILYGRPHKDLPLLDFTVRNAGRPGKDGEHIMEIQITARDGSLSQSLEVATGDPDFFFGPFNLVDMNFDGYLDLDITVGLGATNRLSVVSLWLPAEHRFAQPLTEVELCNYTLNPQRKEIWSSVRDGWAYGEHMRYAWEGDRLIPLSYGERYYTGEPGFIGERVTTYSPADGRATVVWDEQYPEEWYGVSYGWVDRERQQVLFGVVYYDMLSQSPLYAVVDNVDWVNLRHMERKTSDSIGKINAGEIVQVLRFGCGEDQGWVRVLWNGRTGYIWHSFLRVQE